MVKRARRAKKEAPTTSEQDASVSESDVQCVKRWLRQRSNPMCEERCEELLKDQLESLCGLMQRTITAKENTAALLVGHRGCGKSVTLERALSRMQDVAPNGLVKIYLNGMIQTDDTLAIREICRQLKIDAFLQRLQREREEHEHGTEHVNVKSQSFTRCTEDLHEFLRSGKLKDQPIFIVLDEFDQFAHRTKQTLLYNLFDLLQSGSVQMCVVGVSTRLDVYELLEKRIRSRFSHRRILFPLLASADAVTQFTRFLLTIPAHHTHTDFHRRFNDHVQSSLSQASCKRLIRDMQLVGCSLSHLVSVCAYATAHLTATSCFVYPELVCQSLRTIVAPEVSFEYQSLQHKSHVQLAVLVAMVQLERQKHERYTFEMVLDCIKRSSRHDFDVMVHHYSRSVVLGAFEQVLESGIALFVAPRPTVKSAAVNKNSVPRKEFQDVRLWLDAEDTAKYIRDKVSSAPAWIVEWSKIHHKK